MLLTMLRYDSGLGQSYNKYLYDRSFQDDLKDGLSLALSRQSRELIGTMEALRGEGITVVNQEVIANTRGVELAIERCRWQLGKELDEISGQLVMLGMALDYGITNVLVELGGINQSLEEILEVLETPIEVTAYNHFNIARDNFRRKLHPEALERLEKAISGEPGISSGYKEGWEFHQLKGLVLLDFSPLQDPIAAEKAFITAERYAPTPTVKSIVLLSASKAAEMAGRFGPAFEYADKGRELIGQVKWPIESLVTDLQYQTARMHIALGRIYPGFAIFREMVRKDLVPYIVRAADDYFFQMHNGLLDLTLKEYRIERLDKVRMTISASFSPERFEELSTYKVYKNLPGVAELRKIYLDENNWGVIDFIRFVPKLKETVYKVWNAIYSDRYRRKEKHRLEQWYKEQRQDGRLVVVND